MKIIMMMMGATLIIAFAIVSPTFSLLRNNSTKNGQLKLADWNVSLNQTGVNNSLSIVPDASTANYTLNVRSLSEVDVVYDVVISNLPTGVQVSFDGGSFLPQDANHTITITNAGTLLYASGGSSNSHTLTFRAVSGTAAVSNQTVDIDVIAQQVY